MQVIYENLITGLNEFGYKIDISGDASKRLIWQGENIEDLSFTREQILGLDLVEGQVIFSQERFDNATKPVAYGVELLEFIQAALRGQDVIIRGALFSIFQNLELEPEDVENGYTHINIVSLLQSRGNNPMPQTDFNELVSIISKSTKIAESTKNLILGITTQYQAIRRFA